jgi:flagellar biosynthesis/type III secretory pathway M-ring protein FliF/YscJ
MDPQSNQQQETNQEKEIAKNRMVWIWIGLIGGFVIILLLLALLFYQPRTDETNVIQENIQNEQEEQISPADENIDQEVEDVDLGDLESDYQEVEEDIDQL